MFKKYLWAISVILPASWGLVFLSWQGWLPFSDGTLFGLFFLLLIGVAFFRPREFFWFFLASLSLENVFLAPNFFPLSLRLYQLVGVALFLALILKATLKKKEAFLSFRFWEGKTKKTFNLLALVVFSWLVVFSLGDWNEVSAKENIKWFLIVVSFVFLFWLAGNFLRTWKERAEGLFFFLLGGATVWLAGFYQVLAVALGWKSFVVMTGRVNGTFLEPDWLGIYWAFLLGLLLGLKIFFTQWENGKKLSVGKYNLAKVLNWLLNGKIFFSGMMLALTVSRSAWLASGAVLLVYGILLWRGFGREIFSLSNLLQGFKEALMVGLILVASFGAVKLFGFSDFNLFNRATSTVSGEQEITISCQKNEVLPERIENVSELTALGCRHIDLEEIQKEKAAGLFVKKINRPDPNVDIRKKIYLVAWQEIKKHPWLGQGWGASARILGQDEKGSGLNASNIFLEIWLSAGILALMSFLWVLFLVVKEVSLFPKSFQGFFLLSLTAFLVANLFNAGIFSGFFWIFLASLSFNKRQ